jgi:hypothetical protein
VAEGWLQELKAGSTFTSNVFAFYNANGEKVNKWTVGEWYTVVIKPTKTTLLCLQTNAQNGTVEPPVMYVKNLAYRTVNPFPVNPTIIVDSSKAILEKQTAGEFAGAYKYVNNTLGRAGGVSNGAGVSFKEIYDYWGNGYAAGQTFFNDGYKYVKFDFYAESSVYSMELQMGWSVDNNKWVEKLTAGKTFTSNYYSIYDKNGAKVNKWTAGEWYTLLIKPIEGNMLFVQTNAQTADSEAPVMYVKNLSYETENPFARKTMVVNTALASLEMQTEGDFAGAYKYTNWSLGRGTNQSNGTGIYFDEVFSGGVGAANQTFFKDGYQYIAIDFYAEESVYSLELQIGWSVDGNKWIEKLTAGKTFTSDYFSIYNQNGEKVNSWTAGQWYTIVIKPLKCSDSNAWEYPLNIQANAETAESEAPVMYFKDATYSVKNPYAGN